MVTDSGCQTRTELNLRSAATIIRFADLSRSPEVYAPTYQTISLPYPSPKDFHDSALSPRGGPIHHIAEEGQGSLKFLGYNDRLFQYDDVISRTRAAPAVPSKVKLTNATNSAF